MAKYGVQFLAACVLLLCCALSFIVLCLAEISFDGTLTFVGGMLSAILNNSTHLPAHWTNYSLPYNESNYIDVKHSQELFTHPTRLSMVDFNVSTKETVTSRKFAAVATTMLPGSYTYSFFLPLTVLSWKRISYETLVVIVGDENIVKKDRHLSVILDFTIQIGAYVKFIPCLEKQSIRFSQISRIFFANIFKELLNENDILVTSDVDLWPLDKTLYDVPNGKLINSYNGLCCGFFKHKNRRYRMLPISNIAATVSTWRQILSDRATNKPSTKEEIFDYTKIEFGTIVNQTLHKGGNTGWFLDQHLISVKIFNWLDGKPPDILYYANKTSTSRIDRSRWKVETLEGKQDVHLLLDAHNIEVWKRILPLLKLMFGENSREYNLCLHFYKMFSRG